MPHFLQPGLAVTLLILYLDFQSKQPSLLPCGARTEILRRDNLRKLPKAELAPPVPFTDAVTEAQRGHDACLRPHSFDIPAPDFACR